MKFIKPFLYLVLFIVSTAVLAVAWVKQAEYTLKLRDRTQALAIQKYELGRAKILKLLDATDSTVFVNRPSDADINPRDLEAMIDRAEMEYEVPAEVIKAVIAVESGWKNSAIRYEPHLRKGADTAENRVHASSHGLMQVIPMFWKGEGPCPEEWSELYQPMTNIRCGTYVLSEAMKKTDNLRDAIKIYNCGRADCSSAEPHASKVIDTLLKDYMRELNNKVKSIK
jgi:soluble lytic murein transglycosylase-like protein